MSKQSQLNTLKQEILDKNIGANLSTTATQLVFGDGNPDAKILFIGEAPGKQEDEQGLPFVGASGKFLNEMLATVGLERKDVYITNIVKYRPPNNRDPLPEEKKEFWPYLRNQIKVIKPDIIVTLGRHSMSQFLPDAKISQAHGQKFKVKNGNDEVILVPLYHPAAALYNGGMRQTLLDDFASLSSCIEP